MEPLGTDLRTIRERSNLELRQVADDTRISLRYLQSLEEGRYGDLPGGIYNRAFLKTYCEYLGIDPDPMLARYEAESAPLREKAAKFKAKVPRDGTISRLPPAAIWTFMLLCSMTGLYFTRKWIGPTFAPYFSRSPAVRVPEGPPTVAPSQPSLEARSEARSTEPPPRPPDVDSAESGRDRPRTSTSLPSEKKSEPPQLPSSRNSIRLQFHVLQKCWVSVTSDGTRVLVKVLEAGDDQSFDAERFNLIFGNAAGVQLKINGKPAKSLGKPGEVARVLINAQNIHEFTEISR